MALKYSRIPLEIILAVPAEMDPKGVAVVLMEALAALPIVASVRTTGEPVDVSRAEMVALVRENIATATLTVVVSEMDDAPADHTLN